MGRRGPVPAPVKLKILRGERASRINRQAPEPKRGLPRIPTSMSHAARVVWYRQIRLYGATGVLTGVDADAMRVYCEAVVRYEQASVLLEQSGPIVKGRDGNLVRNPLHQVVRDEAILIRAFARELGFTPAARSSITNIEKQGAEDPLEEWMAK